MRFLTVFLIIFSLFNINAYGMGELDNFDTEGIEDTVKEETGLSFDKMFYKVISGKGTEVVQDIVKSLSDLFFKEIKDNSAYVKSIVIVSILCGILNIITSDLKDKSISELVFFAGEILVITIAVVAFKETISILKSAVLSIVNIVSASLPFLISILAAGGKATTVLTSGGVLSVTTAMISQIVSGIIVPLIIITTLIRIVNVISKRDMLKKMSKLSSDVTGYIIKGGGYLYMFLMSFEKIGGGMVNNLIKGSAKSAIGAVPVIGDVVEGSIDIAAGVVKTAATGSGIVIVIILIVTASIPVIKILVITGIYKFLAAVVEPLCDKGTVEIIDCVGDGCKLILASLFMVVFMFVVSTLVVLGGLM